MTLLSSDHVWLGYQITSFLKGLFQAAYCITGAAAPSRCDGFQCSSDSLNRSGVLPWFIACAHNYCIQFVWCIVISTWSLRQASYWNIAMVIVVRPFYMLITVLSAFWTVVCIYVCVWTYSTPWNHNNRATIDLFLKMFKMKRERKEHLRNGVRSQIFFFFF